MSRRTFLALTAGVAVSCRGDDEGSSDSVGAPSSSTPATSSSSTTTSSSSTTTSSTTTTISTTTSTTTEPVVTLASDPFLHGVASGDPDGSTVVLWTRLGGDLPEDGVDVEWEVADGDGEVVDRGRTRTSAAQGWSVHAVAQVGSAATYRFRVGGYESPVGRTSSLAGRDRVRLASASCQHYERGHYAAHRDIAEWQPDLVLFLGDFIYEGAASDPANVLRTHEGPEPTDLDGYRARYATYLSDPHLQAARATCPWLVIWDDHEVVNNYAATTTPAGDDPEVFARRRQAAYRAWWENTPTRVDEPTEDPSPVRIHRCVEVGSLLRISALDGRQYRSVQVCDVTLDPGPPCPGTDDPDRTMLGDEQERWLADRLRDSTADWDCIAQQTVMSDLRVPLTGGVLNYDQWDGYAPARDRLLADAPDGLVVVTGDIHLAGIGRLTTGGRRVGVEFVTTAVSSTANVDPSLEGLVTALPNIVDANLTDRGYTRHTVDRDVWRADYRSVVDVTDPDSPVRTWKSFEVARGSTEAVAV